MNRGYVGFRKSDGKWFARRQGTSPDGKRIDRTKFGRDEAHARELLAQLIAETTGQAPASPVIALNGSALATTSPITFKQLADAYSAHKVKPAQYRNDRKIAGLRSVDKVKIRIRALHVGLCHTK